MDVEEIASNLCCQELSRLEISKEGPLSRLRHVCSPSPTHRKAHVPEHISSAEGSKSQVSVMSPKQAWGSTGPGARTRVRTVEGPAHYSRRQLLPGAELTPIRPPEQVGDPLLTWWAVGIALALPYSRLSPCVLRTTEPRWIALTGREMVISFIQSVVKGEKNLKMLLLSRVSRVRLCVTP